MTEEERKVEAPQKDCCCCKMFCKFLLITASVFTGTLLALLVAKALTQPKFPPCPCAFRYHRPGIERQMPPQYRIEKRGMHGHHFKGEKKNIKGQKPSFEK